MKETAAKKPKVEDSTERSANEEKDTYLIPTESAEAKEKVNEATKKAAAAMQKVMEATREARQAAAEALEAAAAAEFLGKKARQAAAEAMEAAAEAGGGFTLAPSTATPTAGAGYAGGISGGGPGGDVTSVVASAGAVPGYDYVPGVGYVVGGEVLLPAVPGYGIAPGDGAHAGGHIGYGDPGDEDLDVPLLHWDRAGLLVRQAMKTMSPGDDAETEPGYLCESCQWPLDLCDCPDDPWKCPEACMHHDSHRDELRTLS